MSSLIQLVSRGNTVMREWNNENIDHYSKKMIAEIAAATLVNICGLELANMTKEQQKEKADLMRIALTSAFQIGVAHKKPRHINKNYRN